MDLYGGVTSVTVDGLLILYANRQHASVSASTLYFTGSAYPSVAEIVG